MAQMAYDAWILAERVSFVSGVKVGIICPYPEILQKTLGQTGGKISTDISGFIFDLVLRWFLAWWDVEIYFWRGALFFWRDCGRNAFGAVVSKADQAAEREYKGMVVDVFSAGSIVLPVCRGCFHWTQEESDGWSAGMENGFYGMESMGAV